jgi:hypothetical protein
LPFNRFLQKEVELTIQKPRSGNAAQGSSHINEPSIAEQKQSCPENGEERGVEAECRDVAVTEQLSRKPAADCTRDSDGERQKHQSLVRARNHVIHDKTENHTTPDPRRNPDHSSSLPMHFSEQFRILFPESLRLAESPARCLVARTGIVNPSEELRLPIRARGLS